MRTFFIASALLSCATLFGQVGTLDPSFDGDGLVSTAIGSINDKGTAVCALPDGKILVAGRADVDFDADMIFYGDIALVRYMPDGSLDTTFGTGGMVTTDIGGEHDGGWAIAAQPDGKIMVAGSYYNGPQIDGALVRYLADGSLDPDFNGDGIATVYLGPGNDVFYSLALQPDGKILVGGARSSGGSALFAVMRFLPDGSPDGGFGSAGFGDPFMANTPQTFRSIALRADGTILAGGFAGLLADADLALCRYLPDGSLDASFGTNGGTITSVGSDMDQIMSIAEQADGKVVAVGRTRVGTQDDVLLVRYLSDGSLDGSFGTGGVVVYPIGLDHDLASSVVVTGDGKILVGAQTFDGTFYDPVVLRFLPDGSLDTGFGSGGIVTLPVHNAQDLGNLVSLALHSAGGILIVGSAHNGSNFDVSVARIINDLNIGVTDFMASGSPLSIYPNPLADHAVFEYELASDERLTCELYDDQGRCVRTLFKGSYQAGVQRAALELSGIAAGCYTIVLCNGMGCSYARVLKR